MSKKPASETVAFRASNELVRLIDRERERFGVSRGEMGPGHYLEKLFQEEQENALARLDELRNLLEGLRASQTNHNRKLAATLFTLLTEVGEMDADDARVLVRRRIIEQRDTQ